MIVFILIICVLITGGLFYYFHKNRKNNPDHIRDTYFRALNYMLLDETDKAYDLFTEVVQKQSDTLDAYIHLGNILRKRGEGKKALSVHKNLLHRSNLEPEIKTRITKAISADQQALGDFAGAAATLETLTTTWNKDPWVYEHLVKLYEKSGDWGRAYTAQKHFFKITNTSDGELLALYKVRQGEAAASKGNAHQARLRYREALHDSTTCAAAYYHLGASYQKENRPKEALMAWKDLLKKVPNKGFLAFPTLSAMYYERGDFSEFEKMLRAILKSHPNDVHTMLSLADLDARKGDSADAEELLEAALKQEPGLISAHARLIRYQLTTPGKAEEHIKRLEQHCMHGRVFTCHSCHHTSNEPLWHCPQCNSWRSFDI